jgi:hypothetical protein
LITTADAAIERPGKNDMEQLPNWLTAAVAAAGMTAYADELYPKVAPAPAAPSLAAEDGIVPPLH